MSPKPRQPGRDQLGLTPAPGYAEKAEPRPLTLEEVELKKRLMVEKAALDCLAQENERRGIILTKKKQLVDLENAFGIPEDREPKAVSRLKEEIFDHGVAHEDFQIWGYKYFAQSKEIPVHLITRDKINPHTGEPIKRKDLKGKEYVVKEPVMLTDDPAQQDALDAAYADFRATYFGTDNKPALDARRNELIDQIEPLLLTHRSGPDPSMVDKVHNILQGDR